MQVVVENQLLPFTLENHDLLKQCVAGISQILDKMAAAEKRVDGVDDRLKEYGNRLKSLEDWKLKVGSMLVVVGAIFGFVIKVVMDVAPHFVTGKP